MTTKSAAAVLQELMVKLGTTPEYDCISQNGPQHLSTFQYQCKAQGIVTSATARSKKEAKQEVARLMLLELAKMGHNVPSPYSGLSYPSPSTSTIKPDSPVLPTIDSRSYVALLTELCTEYNLPTCEYSLVSDTGPSHSRRFTISATTGGHTRKATSTTKKAARQVAAEQLYTYLRENLHRHTEDFVEEEALVRAHEKAMERYVEVVDEKVWKPDLGQKIADYPLGLINHIDEDKRNAAIEAIKKIAKTDQAPEALEVVVQQLGLKTEYSSLDPLTLVELSPLSPPVVLAARNRVDAAAEALDYLRLTLFPMKITPKKLICAR